MLSALDMCANLHQGKTVVYYVVLLSKLLTFPLFLFSFLLKYV